MAQTTKNLCSSPEGILKKNIQNQTNEYVSDILKSKVDNRKYRRFVLNNGLKVMLVSDPQTEKSAASLDVYVGSFSDPIKLQGLAHFLEHMLFLGTEKYPDPNEYSDFLSHHAGYNNAYTSSSHTNYYFDVDTNFLEPALDRFSQFFLNPILNEIYTDKELNSVHSEFEQYFDSDAKKSYFVDIETCDLTHDYHKFNVGNKKTLKEVPESNNINVREELLNFHSNYYSANIMTLCVLGKESLDDLYDMITKRLNFNEIKNKNISFNVYDKNPYQKEHLKKIIKIFPMKDIRELKIFFQIPDYHDYYHSQPSYYVSHLIGHEGKGSILSELKARGLVDNLFSYNKRKAPGLGEFKIKLDLTEKGLESIDEIVTVVFQYLNMLNKNKPQKWIFDECKIIKDITFDYKEKEKPVNFVLSVANYMHDFPTNLAVKNHFVLDEYNPEIIEDLMKHLTPDNLRITVLAKKFENQTNRKEKYYGINYSYEDIPEETINKWKNAGFNENLHLPTVNEFIPENLELVEREEVLKEPILYKKDEFSRVWYLQDNIFKIPKTFIGLLIKSPIISYDPVNEAAMSIYAKLLVDKLNEHSYSANLAGLVFKINNQNNGFLIEFSGYSEKIFIVLDKVIEQLTRFDFDQNRFDLIKELYYRNVKNFTSLSLYKILNYFSNLFFSEKNFSNKDLLNTFNQVTYERVQKVSQEFFSQFFIEILIHGNVNKKDADLVIEKTKDRIKNHYNSTVLHPLLLLPKRHLKLENNSYYVFEEKSEFHQNNAIHSYYQFGMQDTLSNVKLELLLNIFSESFYSNLRTEEQLGYIVYMHIQRLLGVQGIYFFIQSTYNTSYLDSRIDNFIVWAKEYLNKMTDDEFKVYKESLRVLKSEKPKKLLNSSYEFWYEILLNYYQFNKRNIELEALKTITKKDIQECFNEHFIDNRRKISFRINGSKSLANKIVDSKTIENKNAKIITDFIDVQKNLETYPIAKSYKILY